MEIDYITEPEAPFPYEAWDALNGYISGNYGGLSTEGLSMEGYKETLRHLWEKLVEYLKKIIRQAASRADPRAGGEGAG
jgi:hypothetical protein